MTFYLGRFTTMDYLTACGGRTAVVRLTPMIVLSCPRSTRDPSYTSASNIGAKYSGAANDENTERHE